MTFHTDGLTPAYRLAPDTPAEIPAELARLCAAPVVVMTPTTASPAIDGHAEGITRSACATNGLGPEMAPEGIAPVCVTQTARRCRHDNDGGRA